MFKRIAQAALVVILMASAAFAQTTNTNCTATSMGTNSTDIDCRSTQVGPTPAEAAVQVEQQKELNENMSKLGASVGGLIAQKRAQHAQEKNELTAVVYCRQNPTGNWTFPSKAPMPCTTLERNVIAYCTVNAKTPICKDVAKLPPASTQAMASPDEQRVTINVVYCQQNPNGTVTTGNGEKKGCSDEIAYMTAFCTVHEWKGKSCEALSNTKATAIVSTAAPQVQPQPQPQQVPVTTQPAQNVAVSQQQPQQAPVTTQQIQNLTVTQPQAQSQAQSQPQPQPLPQAKPQPPQPQTQPQVQPQEQMVNVSTTQAPEEISVAEAARRNKVAKEAAKAKENPQAQAQPQQ